MLTEEFTTSFVNNVIYNATQYIEVGLWDGIERSKFERWSRQYKTPEEKLLLAFIVDSLVYRSYEQTAALIEQGIFKNIPQAIYNVTKNESHFSDIERILSYSNDKVRYSIVPVIRDVDPPTKSGPLLARLYKRLGGVSEKLMHWPWQLDKLEDLKFVVFVDDFVGSGNQFLGFLDKHVPKDVFSEDTVLVYCPLTASEKGLENIKNTRSDIQLAPIETITENDNFFSYIEQKYQLNQSQVQELNEIYDNFMEKIGFKKLGGRNPSKNLVRGYRQLALTYAYQHATPNASIPLLWANNDKYSSLFVR